MLAGRWRELPGARRQERVSTGAQGSTRCRSLLLWLRSGRATAVRGAFPDEQEFSSRRAGAAVRVVEGGGRGSLAEQRGNLLSLLLPD